MSAWCFGWVRIEMLGKLEFLQLYIGWQQAATTEGPERQADQLRDSASPLTLLM